MSRFIRAAVCAAVLSTACTAPAFAAEPAGTAAAPAPSKALDCARRYNKAMRMADTMEGVMRGMMPVMMQQYGGSGKSDAEALVLDAIVESTREIVPAMMDALAAPMVATFTEAEVCGLADFYESPVGQGVVTKMPAFSQQSADAMAKFMPLLQADMNRRICRKIDCNVESSPKKAPVRAS